MIIKIVSGGQTGADQAALDAAISMGIAHGGWIPKGRRTENGALAPKYTLQEMPSAAYSLRTEKNVIDSDGTLIFSHGPLTGGSALTMKMARRHRRPSLHIDFSHWHVTAAAGEITAWVSVNNIQILNVAGSRQSEDPGLYEKVKNVVERILSRC